MTKHALIIAYGNPLRSDDGIAWHAAQLLGEKPSLSQAEILCVHQLTPELAEEASRASCVIFMDARQDGEAGKISCMPVRPASEEAQCSHLLGPAQVMALCGRLYGITPRAFEVSITGEWFDHGDALSESVREALPEFIEMVCELLNGPAG